MVVFALAALYGLILAVLASAVLWLYRRANGHRGFPVALLAVLWPLASVGVLVWFYFEILETT